MILQAKRSWLSHVLCFAFVFFNFRVFTVDCKQQISLPVWQFPKKCTEILDGVVCGATWHGWRIGGVPVWGALRVFLIYFCLLRFGFLVGTLCRKETYCKKQLQKQDQFWTVGLAANCVPFLSVLAKKNYIRRNKRGSRKKQEIHSELLQVARTFGELLLNRLHACQMDFHLRGHSLGGIKSR